MLAHILNITVGMTFSAGLIDFTLFGILQGNDKTNWMLVPLVGIGFFIVYYFTFRILITKLNLKTPGREDEDTSDTASAADGGSGNADQQTAAILSALGGKANIEDLDCCATRLRVTVRDETQVSKEELQKTGSKGVIVKGKGVQIIYGPHVALIKTELEEMIQ